MVLLLAHVQSRRTKTREESASMCDKILRLKEELPHLNTRHIIRVNERQERGGMTETMVTVMFQDINALRTLIVHTDIEPYP